MPRTQTMTPSRAWMIEQMRIGNLVQSAQLHYLHCIRDLARHCNTVIDHLEAEQVRKWVLKLIECGRSPASTNSILRFTRRMETARIL